MHLQEHTSNDRRDRSRSLPSRRPVLQGGGSGPEVANAPDTTAASTSLGAGLLTAWSGRMDWATLHQRVYLHDVLACPCGGRRTILADVHDAVAIRDILHALGLPTEPPTLARARDPT